MGTYDVAFPFWWSQTARQTVMDSLFSFYAKIQQARRKAQEELDRLYRIRAECPYRDWLIRQVAWAVGRLDIMEAGLQSTDRLVISPSILTLGDIGNTFQIVVGRWQIALRDPSDARTLFHELSHVAGVPLDDSSTVDVLDANHFESFFTEEGTENLLSHLETAGQLRYGLETPCCPSTR